MKRYLVFAILVSVIFGCDRNNINDTSKRNEHWAWWEDAKTGKGQWLPLTNESSIKDKGKYTLFYFNGNIREVGKLDNGENVDTIFRYDINGILVSYDVPQNNLRYFIKDGAVKRHYSNGRLWEKGIIKNHRYGDKWTQYYENGNVHYVNNFVNDNGWIVNFYESGQIKDSVYHVKDLGDFTIKSWYENGKLEHSNEFKGNNFNGTMKEYYENGHLKDSGTIVNGHWEGIQLQWFENGQIEAINNFKNGKLNGQQFTYHENGKAKTIAFVINGVLSGEAKQYDVYGKLISDDFYKDGVKINKDYINNYK